MTVAQLLQTCEALNTEFNTTAKHMPAGQLAAFRKRLERKYHVTFENSWTVRIRTHVSDTFHARECRTLTRSKKALLGGTTTQYLTTLSLTSPRLPDCEIACTMQTAAPLTLAPDGGDVHASGTFEASVVLLADGLTWKDAAFTGKTQVGCV